MKLLLIGHSVADIISKDDEKRIQPGGIFYTSSAIKELSTENDSIFLCTQIDDKYYNLYEQVYENFDLSFIEKVNSIPLVELIVDNQFERKEHYKNLSNKLCIDYSRLKEFDGILINMITGFDIDLTQLREIRKSTKSIIYFDVHTLSRGLDENMQRDFRLIPDFNKWAENIDIIQCNEHEIFTLSDQKNENEIIKEMFECGIKFMLVTKGESGVRVYYQNKSEVASYFRATKKVSYNNTVGCGDVFGAAFFYGYISSGNIFKAVESASTSAEFIASINNLSEFIKLKENVIE
ncbi:MAG TPA: carbohydrate kinase family protein [Ignavibacteriaceae bacterium]|nr:carbohydrate kinase family protein [Ignavibacteriaceae bacterium]